MGSYSVDFGPSRRAVRLGGASFVINTRAVVVVVVSLLGCLIAFALAVAGGDYPVPFGQLIAVLAGHDDTFASTVVLEWRLPRAVASVVFGAALAVSGALFQSITRNPLGSPDVIGLGAGAYTGALVAIVFLGGGALTTPAALAGGLAAAALVYLLSYRRGLSGIRFVVVGIAVSSALTAVNTILLLRLSTMQATVVSIWGQGTLSDLRWGDVVPASIVLMMIAASGASGLGQLTLGDDTAQATGVTVERVRLIMLIAGVGLTAIVTGLTGPIAFVALAAPHLARLVSGSPGTSLVSAAAAGAFLLSASDVIATQALPVSVPVGVVTVVIGGAYLLGLIVREARRT